MTVNRPSWSNAKLISLAAIRLRRIAAGLSARGGLCDLRQLTIGVVRVIVEEVKRAGDGCRQARFALQVVVADIQHDVRPSRGAVVVDLRHQIVGVAGVDIV